MLCNGGLMRDMVDKCEECKYLYDAKQTIRDIGGSSTTLPKFKCRKYHKLLHSDVDGWVPNTISYTCPDFERRSP